jgi:hypothetical protein
MTTTRAQPDLDENQVDGKNSNSITRTLERERDNNAGCRLPSALCRPFHLAPETRSVRR